MTTALVPTNYAALLEKVRKVLAEGRARAKAALEHEEVRTWWGAAKIVNDHLRNHRGRAAYGEKIVTHLAEDLGVTQVYVYDILRFQKAFRIVNLSLLLTLSHYRILSKIEDAKERKLLYRNAVRNGLSVPELLNEIRSRKLLASDDLKLDGGDKGAINRAPTSKKIVRKLRPLIPRRGKFYTYQIVKPRDLHEHPGFYSVDLGFGNRIDLRVSGIQSPKEGDVIEAVRIEKNERGDRYRFKRVGAGLKPAPKNGVRRVEDLLYTYKATVRDVLDDDTLWADIDLGFRVWTERKLRLRGIDAAEVEKGKPASDFVKRTLAKVQFAVVTISGRDKFGRPLADLFYLEGTEDREKVLREGTYLNQELLDLGLAKRI